MIKEDLIKQLNAIGYDDFTVIELSKCKVHLNAKNEPFYPRDNLLSIFQGRLRGCEQHDPNNEIKQFLIESISKLESIGEDTPIYFWEIVINGEKFAGRSTTNQILHIYPYPYI